MDLYIQRHAVAVTRGTEGYAKDGDRPLTGKGAKKMREVAKGMLALGLSFDGILSSPFVRARQTAEIVADVFHGSGKLAFTPHLQVGGDPEMLIDLVGKRYGHHGALLLVGHEPYLSRFISVLIAGVRDASITMKKGGLCKLRVEEVRYGRCATLEWLLTPRQLSRAGKE